MILVAIDETKPIGKKIIKQIAENPKIGTVKNPNISRDEQGNIIGISLEEMKDQINDWFKGAYKVNYNAV